MSATITGRFLKLVMTVVVLCAATGHVASAQTCTQFYPDVLVTISVAANGTVNVDTDPACVDVGGTLTWTSSDGSWTTQFPANASAFPSGKEKHAGKAGEKSGDKVKECKKDKAHHYKAPTGGCVFKYTVSDTVSGKLHKKDPQVIINPGS